MAHFVITKYKLANISLLVVAMLWGTSFSFQKSLFDSVGPATQNFYAFTFCAIIFSLLNFNNKLNIFYRWHEGLVLGAFLGVFETIQMYSIYNTSAANAVFITNLGMLLIPFLGFLIFRHKLNKGNIISIIVATLGMYFLVGGFSNFSQGDILAIITALFMAPYFLYSERFQGEKYSHMITLCAQQFIAVTIISLLSVFMFRETLLVPNAKIFTLIWQSVLFTFVPYVLIQWASKTANEMQVAVYDGIAEPLIGGIVAWVIFKEVASVSNVMGAMIMIIGFGVGVIYNKRKI